MNLKRFLKEANPFMCVYLSLVHILGFYGLFYLLEVKWQTHIAFVIWYWIAGLGITGGAHRLWAHRSFQASWPVTVFLMLCNSCANQGSIFHWVRDHRVHHKFSETAADPHDASRGFFFSHMGWLLLKKTPEVKEAGKKIDMSDLSQDPIIMFQERLNPWIQLFFCFAVPPVIAYYWWGEAFWPAFLLLGVTRYVAVLHATWTVNSVAHSFGYKPYDPSISPAENGWVSFFSLGEGWHNWHHTYPTDYATSEFGPLDQVNPTKVFIDVLAALGLVWDLKRSTDTWSAAKKRMESQVGKLSQSTNVTSRL